MVFYRKYRPQTIDELDNKEVRDNLTAILQKDVPHAFLFTGPKGLGKTSTARIVAKVINCTERNQESRIKNQEEKEKKTKNHDSSFMIHDSLSIEPCNTCETCTTITNGTNLDVLEIDAASNRGIDEIRELKDKIRLAPLSTKKKVYIIDEVHMLTTEAFNALLKTLEEPPEHAVFILCTTESHKVPSTILSRSFHIAFHLATQEELVRSFKRIVAGEKLAVTDDALLEIARLSEGGFRDGAKVFEEVVALAKGRQISKELIEQTYQIKGLSMFVTSLLEAFQERESKRGLQVISDLVNQGTDIKYFLTVITEVLHAELLQRNGIGVSVSGYTETLSMMSNQDITDLLRVCMQVQVEMRSSVLVQLPLELAIVEWGAAKQNMNHESGVMNQEIVEKKKIVVIDKADIKNDLAGSDVAITTQSVTLASSGVSVTSLRKEAGNIAKIKALYGEEKETVVKETIKTTDLHLQDVPNDGVTQEWLTEFWRCIISEMKSHNHTLAGVLRGCMIKGFDKKQLIIETAFTFHKEKLDDPKTKQLLEQVCRGLVGSSIQVIIELKSN